MGLTFILSIFRDPVTSSIPELEAAQRNPTFQLRTFGPYRSEYGRLVEFPHLPPLLGQQHCAIAAGFGVYHSSASLALLQFVTNTLLAERSPGIHIQTALTRHEDVQIVGDTSGPEPELVMGHLDIKHDTTDSNSLFAGYVRRYDKFVNPRWRALPLVFACLVLPQTIIGEVSQETEVYFCGGGGVNAPLCETCARRGIKYVGRSVQ
ncbi:unnamed protein product [Ectocarpus sp. CCAP 1310/34]|nr:unnamed protein product [Ectocarpus sp. CCAP 1310/34]